MSSPRTYALSDLPALLEPGADDVESYRIARKVQNWVTTGLACPIANAHGGRGVHRRYDDSEVAKLRVLLELTRYGLPTTVLERAAGLFDEMREPPMDSRRLLPRGRVRNPHSTLAKMRALWSDVRAGKRGAYLLMSPDREGGWTVELLEAPNVPKGAPSAVLVDVGHALRCLMR